jgi:hypothetical protein
MLAAAYARGAFVAAQDARWALPWYAWVARRRLQRLETARWAAYKEARRGLPSGK